MSEQIETIVIPKPVQKTARPKKPFSGFDIDLSVELPDLTLRIPLKYAKIDSKAVQQKLKITHRVGNVDVENKPSPYRTAGLKVRQLTTGRPSGMSRTAVKIRRSLSSVAKWGWFDETGKEYPEAMVQHFQELPDGREQEVQPFPRSSVLETLKLMDTVALDEFLVESR